MSRHNRRIIQYAIHKDDGIVVSRVDNEVAWPIIDYEAIGKDGDFTKPITAHLEAVSVFSVGKEWQRLKWTKKIPVELKNLHRAFWGMAALHA